jgi:hypothetical protein
MAVSDKRAGCLKYGCMGCGGVALLGLILIGVMAVMTLLGGTKDPKFEAIDLAQGLERTRAQRIHPSEGDSADRIALPGALDTPKPGKIVLDVSMCRFSVEPGPAGEPIRVEGRYDSAGYELEQDYSTDTVDGWTYRLSFQRRGFGLLLVEGEGSNNHLRLIVPVDAPFVLVGTIGIGESEVELGGLWLRDVDLDIGIGEHEIRFSEPLAAPLERLRLDGSIGETRILHVGNASPSSVEIKHSIGELLVDLRGEWKNDATVATRCGIGSCNLRMPRDVGVVLEDAGVMIGESNLRTLESWPPADPGAPVLTLSITNKLGELNVRR